jgi:hypothetical protein
MKLRRLTRAGRALVDEAFLTSPDAKIHPSPGVLEDVGIEIDWEPVQRLVRRVTESFEQGSRGIDGYAAPLLHQALAIPRRVARDRGVWHYLSVAAFPEFVRHRWQRGSDGRWFRDRFLGIHQQNTFARLWWAAELSRDGEDYSLAARIFGSGLERVFDRAFSWHAPMLRAFVGVMANSSGENVDRVASDLNYALTTIAVEVLDERESERLIRDIQSLVNPRTFS